ncbi:MAG: DNA-processing protein DprA [Mogibacterium sp.]|nr:DNA-processing protein DprA [Mogibacterium sp.]MBQ6501847.1 DNA-processing protein DprA [Mogibacterium sp.]
MMETVKIDIDSIEYPARLREIPDPPKQLYCTGNTGLLNEKSIGVVGARKNTVYGKNVALMIGRRLAESGLVVTSGLALGIDGYSHEGALEAEGKVIGVLGSGIDHMTPQRHRSLMMKGLDNGGLVVSEYPPEMECSRWSFPARNRIISGLSDALVVVEAGLDSGSLITAKHASDQGRTVYAVPGNINSQTSIGCNLLIRDGAVPLIIIDDLIRDVGAMPVKSNEPVKDLDSDEQKIFEVVMEMSGATMEEIIRNTGFSPGLANSLVTVMEIKGIVESYAGRIYLSR